MIRLISVLASAVLLAAGLAACGGGSVSSGGGGGGARDASNLVVKVDGSSRSASVQETTPQGSRLAAAVSEFLISSAQAEQLEGHEVFVLDPSGVTVAVGTTDETGEVAFSVPENEEGEVYTVCIDDPTVSTNCADLTASVGPQQVVTATVEQDATGQTLLASAQIEDTGDDIALFEDPEKEHKTILCHNVQNNPRTISVATVAAENAHLAHGDTLGPCPEEGTGNSASNGNNGNGNNGNNGNGNNGNGNNGDDEA